MQFGFMLANGNNDAIFILRMLQARQGGYNLGERSCTCALYICKKHLMEFDESHVVGIEKERNSRSIGWSSVEPM